MDVSHYRGLRYWGPLSPARIESVLDLLDLDEDKRALDVGCGRGELLLRIAERFGAAVVGVDRSPGAIAQAESGASARVSSAADFHIADANEFHPDGSFDFVSWLGGPYLGESAASTIESLARWTCPGGYLLVGHGFWQGDPPAPYLEATGIPTSAFGTHGENIEMGRHQGLALIYSCVSNRDEWDAFEGRLLFNWEERLSQDVSNDELRALVEGKRAFNDAQQQWGRTAMGFGLYLYRKPRTQA